MAIAQQEKGIGLKFAEGNRAVVRERMFIAPGAQLFEQKWSNFFDDGEFSLEPPAGKAVGAMAEGSKSLRKSGTGYLQCCCMPASNGYSFPALMLRL